MDALNISLPIALCIYIYIYIIKRNKRLVRIVLLSECCWLVERRDHMFRVWSWSPDLHVASAKHIPRIMQKMTVTAQCEVFSVNVLITSGLSPHHAAVRGKHCIPCVMSCDMWLYTHSCMQISCKCKHILFICSQTLLYFL